MIIRRFVLRCALILSLAALLRAQTNSLSPSLFPATGAPSDGLDLRFADGIAAIAEDKVITVDDVRRRITPVIPEIQRDAHNEKEFKDKLEALQDDIIQQLIDKVLIVKEFYKKKDGEEVRHVPASVIDNQISETLITQFDGDRSKFLAYLKSRGQTNRDYRLEVEEDIVYDYMRHQQLKSQSAVSPVKIEIFYNENKDRFFQEDSVKLRLIQLTRASGETDESLHTRVNTILEELKKGVDFAELARQYSQEAHRTKGGDWGWLKRSDLRKEFGDVLFNLKKGQYSEPLTMPEACYLLYVEDRKYAGIQPLDEVRDEIERILVAQQAQVSEEKWLERLRRNGYVKHF